MTGDVDHVVNPAEDAVVAVGSKHRSVGGEIRPVAPVLAVRVLAELRVVLADEPFVVVQDRLHDAGPGIADAEIARSPRTGRNFLAVLVVDHGKDSERPWSGAS